LDQIVVSLQRHKNMTKLQLTVVGASVLLLLGLYLGFDTKPPSQATVEKQRSLAATSTDIDNLLQEAKDRLSAAESASILSLEAEVDEASNSDQRSERLKSLSGKWYEIGYPAIAGFYAEEVAQIDETEASWSIAGTTYSLGIQQSESSKVRSFCTERAVQAFENAISLNPGNAMPRINLALVYTENPPADNPMKGILMLRELEQQFPEEPAVLVNLARLAIRTGQFEKAVERLNQALELAPDNTKANCLLAQAYDGLGDTAKAKEFASRCN
jgi:tetratricopeptide (TPR) repeat protein